MCGIVGILKLNPGEGVAEERLKRMRDTLVPTEPRLNPAAFRQGSPTRGEVIRHGEWLKVASDVPCREEHPAGVRIPLRSGYFRTGVTTFPVRDILTDCKDFPPPYPPSIRYHAVLS
jgi:hypothetical protein